jgi:polyphenol oxidase
MIASDILKTDGIRHAFFTRKGGVSSGIYTSLNCGFGSQDRLEDVRENRARVARMLGAEPPMLITAHQVHSARAVVADAPWDKNPEADAIVTNTPGLAIGVLTADCTPILFADPEARVVGAAHAGWRGAKTGIIAATITAMEDLGAKRSRIRAAIGPTISQNAYEVGPEFEAAFIADAPSHKQYFQPNAHTRPYFDLPGYCHDRLKEEYIEFSENLRICTYENDSFFFSYRRSTHNREIDYGRQISAILIL